MKKFFTPIACARNSYFLLTCLYWGYNLHIVSHFRADCQWMSRMTKRDLRTHSFRDEELKKRLGIESLLDEILDRRRKNWMEKVANMPATLDGNRLPCKLLGALKVRDNEVANWKLYANIILNCCKNFNLTQTIHLIQLYEAPTPHGTLTICYCATWRSLVTTCSAVYEWLRLQI